MADPDNSHPHLELGREEPVPNSGFGEDLLLPSHRFQPLYDGRVNIPDVFRVGYGLGRCGGVKPVR